MGNSSSSRRSNNLSRTKSKKTKGKTLPITKSLCNKVVEVDVSEDWNQVKHKFSMSTFIAIRKKPGYIHRIVDFNKMEAQPIKIKSNWKVKKETNRKWINEYWCDPNKTLLTKKNAKSQNLPPKTKKYLTHDNHGRPFMIAVTPNKTVKVFEPPSVKYAISDNDRGEMWTFTEQVLSVKPKKIFEGVSPKCEMTKFSGGYGKGTLNNSMLLHLKNNEYLYIGHEIYKFVTPNGDRIFRYTSPVGNNDVPYPAAFGEQNIYFLIEDKYVPLDKLKKPLTKEAKMEPYGEILYWQEDASKHSSVHVYEQNKAAFHGSAKKIKKKMIRKRH